jgi:hypothetical protein
MEIPDLINGSFELLAGFFLLNNGFQVIKDKSVAGVSIISVMFFTLWGFWNLFYYPHLNQMISFFGGLLIVVANTFWVVLLLKYRKPRKEGEIDEDQS